MVQKLEAAGAVIVGKTNLDEFAMGSSTENSAFKRTRNPWDTDRVPGGSSGGSAAALAAGMCCGVDRLGHRRLDPSAGGAVRAGRAEANLRPGVSRYGLVAFASSLDQIGPFGWTVADAALLMNVISGHDPEGFAPACPSAVPDYLADLERPLEGLRMGSRRNTTWRAASTRR